MRVTFLGTGTSVGVPAITCRCAICTSEDPRNNRLRASLLLEWSDGPDPVRVLVDTTTDLRQQALRAEIPGVDGVLYTHHHADHVLGLDELRIFYFVHGVPVALYGRQETLDAVQSMFAYAFKEGAAGTPKLELHTRESIFELRGVKIEPIPVQHHRLTISAYRIGDFAYVTDCNGISESSAQRLAGVKTLVLPALRRSEHPAHFTLEQALQQAARIGAARTYLTHLSHEFDHDSLQAELPDGVFVAHDGLVLDVDERAQ
jgi:phosphoribosyl 1,2-cyclic phosphate phosphodiesterase